ncbi:DUF6326 family protein [Croceitalea rosinachiae]|uniref:DUF6326 family protein n=1 Tax=Croceitalea rosinachiae TaxID=3075596 RepID=A0ABU3A615_9FLAO|nr:DUF6326 family protein [Croceitalea sp. F388]MDT0605622.1 DUF6326 family protein [Croceitalea sp. F388]
MLSNPTINIKIKLSSLWASLMALYIYGDYFDLYTPNKIPNMLEGKNLLDSPTKLFLAALLLAIPALMIALSVLLKPKLNRILNIVIGVLLTIVVILVGSTSISIWYSFYVFYAFLEALVTILIVYYAWTWPKDY